MRICKTGGPYIPSIGSLKRCRNGERSKYHGLQVFYIFLGTKQAQELGNCNSHFRPSSSTQIPKIQWKLF